MLRGYSILIYLFLYAPIALIVALQLQQRQQCQRLPGISPSPGTARRLTNPFVIEALENSLIVAGTSAVLATLMGTMAALALQQRAGALARRLRRPDLCLHHGAGHRHRHRDPDRLGQHSSRVLNGFLASLWPGGQAPQLAMGYGSIIAAHTLFTMALVIVIVRARIAGMDRSLIEASMDLYADALGHLPPGDPAAAHAGHRRGLSAELHLQPRRFRHRLLRRRARRRPCRSTSSPRSAAA